MGKVYITKANMTLICKSILDKNVYLSRNLLLVALKEDFIETEIIKKDHFNDFFNTEELKSIYYMKMILKDLKILLKDIKENKNLIIDYLEERNKKYAYPSKAPAYHTHNKCEWLNKKFSNIKIPELIKSDKKLFDEFKVWINKYKNKDINEINRLFRKKFGFDFDLELVTRKNSSSIDFDNKEMVSDLEIKIKESFKNMSDLSFDSNVKKYKYKQLEWIVTNKNNNKVTSELLNIESFLQIKSELKESLFNYYREKYNADLTFDSSILDAIGFHLCNSCLKTFSSADLVPQILISTDIQLENKRH